MEVVLKKIKESIYSNNNYIYDCIKKYFFRISKNKFLKNYFFNVIIIKNLKFFYCFIQLNKEILFIYIYTFYTFFRYNFFIKL